MRRFITIPLTAEERELLRQLAARELRDPRRQALLLLRDALRRAHDEDLPNGADEAPR